MVGGVNATLMSGRAVAQSQTGSQDESTTTTGPFLGTTRMSEEHTWTQRADLNAAGSLASYDSLQNSQVVVRAEDGKSYADLRKEGKSNIDLGARLVRRVEDEVRKIMSTAEDAGVKVSTSVEKCRKLCSAGLVTELLLLPHSGLRQYVEALHSV